MPAGFVRLISKRGAIYLFFASDLLIGLAFLAEYAYVQLAGGRHAWYAVWNVTSRWHRSGKETLAGPFSSRQACDEWIVGNTDRSVAHGCEPRLH